MGCSGSKPGVEESMENVRANPVKALPNLMTALDQPTGAGQDEGKKQDTPKVFELLPKAISSLSVTDTKAVVAACDVIKCCVKHANAPAGGNGVPPIDASSVQECVSQLSSLLHKAASRGTETYREHFMEDNESSLVTEAIAGAMKALFQLEEHGAACRQQFQLCGGLKSASDSVVCDSGIRENGRKAIVTMFLAFVETPECAKDFIEKGCISPIVPYCDDAGKYGVSREFQRACMLLLESLLQSGQNIKNRDQVEAAFEKAKNRKSSIVG